MGQFASKKKDADVVVIGLDNSGKTTLLNYMRPPEMKQHDVVPTIGFQVETFKFKGIKMTAFDMAGQGRYRNLWSNYYANAGGIIFVVDSSDALRVVVAKDELDMMLNDDAIKGKSIPVLFFANKMDLPNALGPTEMNVDVILPVPAASDPLPNGDPLLLLEKALLEAIQSDAEKVTDNLETLSTKDITSSKPHEKPIDKSTQKVPVKKRGPINPFRIPQIMYAIKNNIRIELISALIVREVDLNGVDKEGKGLLYHSVLHRSKRSISFFLHHGIQVNRFRDEHNSPVIQAVKKMAFDADILSVLIHHGGDLTVQNFVPSASRPTIGCYIMSNFPIVQMCYESGYEIRRDKAFFPHNFYVKSRIGTNRAVLKWLKQAYMQPRSLASLCRLKVRKIIQNIDNTSNFRKRLMSLDLPGVILEFLDLYMEKFDDLGDILSSTVPHSSNDGHIDPHHVDMNEFDKMFPINSIHVVNR